MRALITRHWSYSAILLKISKKHVGKLQNHGISICKEDHPYRWMWLHTLSSSLHRNNQFLARSFYFFMWYVVGALSVLARGLQRDVVYLGWPTSALAYEPQVWGRGGAGSQPMSTAMSWSPNKLKISNSIFNLQYGVSLQWTGRRSLFWCNKKTPFSFYLLVTTITQREPRHRILDEILND